MGLGGQTWKPIPCTLRGTGGDRGVKAKSGRENFLIDATPGPKAKTTSEEGVSDGRGGKQEKRGLSSQDPKRN